MLSDAEETLADTDKAGAIGASTDPNAASLPVTEYKNDPQLGEGMTKIPTLSPSSRNGGGRRVQWCLLEGGPQQATLPQRRGPRSSVAPHN
ncbi:hypothetical protein MTO96_041006 [Rhipicephalus appendiculatus]